MNIEYTILPEFMMIINQNLYLNFAYYFRFSIAQTFWLFS